MVLHRHNDITLQNDAVSVPQFIGLWQVPHGGRQRRQPVDIGMNRLVGLTQEEVGE